MGKDCGYGGSGGSTGCALGMGSRLPPHSEFARAWCEGASIVSHALEANGGEQLVYVEAGPVTLEGTLGIPPAARGIVLFAHGSGSSRFSPRNRAVADTLRAAGLATLLIDLLTPEEEAIDLRTRRLRFDISLLASRLIGATDW